MTSCNKNVHPINISSRPLLSKYTYLSKGGIVVITWIKEGEATTNKPNAAINANGTQFGFAGLINRNIGNVIRKNSAEKCINEDNPIKIIYLRYFFSSKNVRAYKQSAIAAPCLINVIVNKKNINR
jgi:hypothetical protein